MQLAKITPVLKEESIRSPLAGYLWIKKPNKRPVKELVTLPANNKPAAREMSPMQSSLLSNQTYTVKKTLKKNPKMQSLVKTMSSNFFMSNMTRTTEVIESRTNCVNDDLGVVLTSGKR